MKVESYLLRQLCEEFHLWDCKISINLIKDSAVNRALSLNIIIMIFLYKRNEEQSDGSELSVLIDQKTYLEEVNRNLR